MPRSKLHSSIPYFLLAALAGLVPVLNNKYPASFFPALPPGGIEFFSVAVGIAAATLGFSKFWARLVWRDRARALVREAVENRSLPGNPEPNDVVNAGRIISRLVRNADEDLREMNPDFTLESLVRLQRYLPELMAEIQNAEEAHIRVGVVGVYLGETLCRNLGWQWFFKSDPSLKQFSYLASVLRKEDREKAIDCFAWAGELLTGKSKINGLLKEVEQC